MNDFPIGWPDFTEAQRRSLSQLGVTKEQQHELRHALICVRQYTRKRPANNDMAAYLADVERLAAELSRKLRGAVVPDAAIAIEKRYWKQRPDDEGPNIAMGLCPRLDALVQAASDALSALPKGRPVRSMAGDPEPVKRIDNALRNGWAKSHPPTVRYPEAMRPSVSNGPQGQGRHFPEIVGICYAAVGYARPPKRAIEAYVKAARAERKDFMADIEAALNKLK